MPSVLTSDINATLRSLGGQFIMRGNLLEPTQVERSAFSNPFCERAERGLEGGGMSPLSDAVTCRGLSEREPVRALRGRGRAIGTTAAERHICFYEN